MISQEDNGDTLRLSNGFVTLEFDRATGNWVSLIDESSDTHILHRGDMFSPLVLSVGGSTLANRDFNQIFTVTDADTIGLHWNLEGTKVQHGIGTARFIVRLAEGDWRAELHYELREGAHRVMRNLVLEYVGEEEIQLRNFTLRFPFTNLGPDEECYLEAPGYPVRPGTQVSWLWHGGWGALTEGAFCESPVWRAPFVGIHRPSRPCSLAVWTWSESEPIFPHADRASEGILFSHRIHLADRVRKGSRLVWSSQYLEIFPLEWLDALKQLQGFYDEAGIAVPADTPEWAKCMNLYEVYVGTLGGTQLSPYPTYEALIADLPRIRAKGFDAIYIMPYVPFPAYSVIDYENLDIQQGSAEDFRRFIQAAHTLGLKVLMDVTIHGVTDKKLAGPWPEPFDNWLPEEHPYLKLNPQWFSKNDRGELAVTTTYAFDHANPSWRDFMIEVFAYYVREYDIDGFRIDSPTWNFFPNWANNLPYPAIKSINASTELFAKLRQELALIKPGIVFLAETCGPLFLSSFDMSYNYDETWMLVNIFPMINRNGILCHGLQPYHVGGGRMSAWDVAYWLAQRRLALPRNAIKLRSFDNHDTYWSACEFRRETFGSDAAKAIVAFFALLDGAFMDFNGADQGLEEFYAKLMRLRHSMPLFREGECDYLSVQSIGPMVLSPIWKHAGRYYISLINLDKAPVKAHLPLLVNKLMLTERKYRLFDHISDACELGPTSGLWTKKDLRSLTLDIEGYGVKFIQIAAVGD